MKIEVENEVVYAMLNYLRDKAIVLTKEDGNWKSLKKEYIKEAKDDKDIVLTEEEMKSIFKMIKEEI